MAPSRKESDRKRPFSHYQRSHRRGSTGRLGIGNIKNGTSTRSSGKPEAIKKRKLCKLRELKKLSKTLSSFPYENLSAFNDNNNSKAKSSKKPAKATNSQGASKVKKITKDREQAGTSGVTPSHLKYDSAEYSASTLSALQCPANLCHVEVCAKPKSSAKVREMKNRLKVLLKKRKCKDVTVPYETDSYLRDNIEFIKIFLPVTEEREKKAVSTSNTKYQIHIFQMTNARYITGDWEEDETVTAKHWILPNREFHGIWDTLIFESTVKEDILNYAMTMLMYGDKQINRNIVCCNRVVLLHGPPGTGKTSLCRAMAQKLCIRLSHKYRHGQLVEINSQGLFSKYYSESGKLVGKMFDKIQEFIDQKDSLVCILIDEVESLAHNRKNMMHGNEPSDSMRVVNALLTRLDEVRRYPNVLVFTTSNVTRAIEAAFLDRADIKKYIGLPNAEAIYSVYQGCVHELMRAEVISPKLKLMDWSQLEGRKGQSSSDAAMKHSCKLKQLSIASVGLSGRSLRKLPMLFHAEYLPAQKMELNNAFWEAKFNCIKKQFKDLANLRKDPEL
ncbi:pachytene checkpoint protein 2 homolog [Watersipora subatra]|uniref:pachytene checkpoint protein 2 homolog n=1 Tax=Watersipora subatra TaxID=2589382 RepID=UPI00355C53B5